MNAFEHERWGITSLSSLSHRDERVDLLEVSINELQGTINDVVDDWRNFVYAIRHEVADLSAKLNLTIRAVGNQKVYALGGIEFTRAKVPKPRHYGGTRDGKKVENFLINMA